MATMTLRQIREGESMPRFSGVAWHRPESRTAVVLPMPFHIVARLGRNAYYWLMFCCAKPSRLEQIKLQALEAGRVEGRTEISKLYAFTAKDQRTANRDGWGQGYSEGFEAGVAALRAEFDKKIDALRTDSMLREQAG